MEVLTVTSRSFWLPPYCRIIVKESSTSLSIPRWERKKPFTDCGRPNRARAWSTLWVPVPGSALNHHQLLNSKLTKAKGHARAGRVFLFCHRRQPRWRLEVVVNLGFLDVPQCALLDEVSERLEVAVLENPSDYLGH